MVINPYAGTLSSERYHLFDFMVDKIKCLTVISKRDLSHLTQEQENVPVVNLSLHVRERYEHEA